MTPRFPGFMIPPPPSCVQRPECYNFAHKGMALRSRLPAFFLINRTVELPPKFAMKQKKVLVTALLFLAAGFGLTTLKILYGGQTLRPEFGRNLWNVSVEMALLGKGERAKVRMTLPQDTERQTVYNENFDHSLEFYTRIRELTGNRIGFWRSDFLEGLTTVRYSFSVQLKSLNYTIPPLLTVPRDPQIAYPENFRVWIDPSDLIQSDDPQVKRQLRKIIGRKKNMAEIHRYLYDFVREEVKYKSEKGSRDARRTLKDLIADCGGKARLFSALSRAAGIPSRVVGGLILTSGIKNITHVWAENYINGQWVPFDVVNGHYARIPENYLELYRGDYALIKHTGLSKFDYFFVIDRATIPPVDQNWSLYALPFKFQHLVRILLLIPLGALVVSFFRVIVGIPTFGTFTPILLALAFREMSVWTGFLFLTLMVALGWFLRSALDRLKVLVIPRISLIVTWVVIGTILLMMFGQRLGFQNMLFVSFFPMIIITWIIERFSVLQIEDGTRTALKTTAGTVAVALVAYFLFDLAPLRAYLFSFPELLLVIMALLLLLGRYTGLRLLEIPRFWSLRHLARAANKES